MLIFCPDCGGNKMHYTGCSFNTDNKTLMRSNYQEIILALQSELAAYKIAVKYFAGQSDQNKDIVANLLKELEG